MGLNMRYVSHMITGCGSVSVVPSTIMPLEMMDHFRQMHEKVLIASRQPQPAEAAAVLPARLSSWRLIARSARAHAMDWHQTSPG